MLGEVVVEEECLEKVKDEFSGFRSESVDREEKLDVLEDIWAGKKLLFSLDLLSKVIDSLQLIDTVQQVADVFDNLLLLFRQFNLFLERRKGCINFLIICDSALEVIRVDIEQSLRVLGQAHGSDRFRARGNPIVL